MSEYFDMAKELDNLFPSFFDELDELIQKSDSDYAKYSAKLIHFLENWVKEQKEFSSREMDDLFWGIQGFLSYYDLGTVSFKDKSFETVFYLLCEKCPETDIKDWSYLDHNVGILAYYYENRDDFIFRENRDDFIFRETIKYSGKDYLFKKDRPDEPRIEFVVGYYMGMIRMCYKMAHNPTSSDLKRTFYNKLQRMIDSLLDNNRFCIGNRYISICDCSEYSRFGLEKAFFNSKPVIELYFEIFSSKMIFIKYDQFSMNSDEASIMEFLRFLYWHITIHSFEDYDKPGYEGSMWKLRKALNATCDSETNNKELDAVIINSIKEHIEYSRIKDLRLNDLCKKLDKKVSDLFDNNKKSIDDCICQMREDMKGFLEFVDEFFIGGYERFCKLSASDFCLEQGVFGKNGESEEVHDKIYHFESDNSSDDSDVFNLFEKNRENYYYYMSNKWFKEQEYYPGNLYYYNLRTDNQQNDVCDIVDLEELLGNGSKYVDQKMREYNVVQIYDDHKLESHDEIVKEIREDISYRVHNYLYHEISYIYSKMMDCAYILEDLYFLYFVWGVVEQKNSKCYDFESINNINKFQSFIYKKSEKKRIAEAYMDNDIHRRIEQVEQEETKKEADRLKDILKIFRDYTKGFCASGSISNCIDYRQRLLADVSNLESNDEEKDVVQEIVDNFSSIIEKAIMSEDHFKPDIDKIEKDINDKLSSLKEIVVNNQLISESDWNSIINDICSFICTGEILYHKYVSPSNCDELNDYGSISIEYYKAVEYIANKLFYKPYFDAHLHDHQASQTLTGSCTNYMTKRHGRYKNTLEYGTVGNFLKNVHQINIAQGFFDSKGVDCQKLASFGIQMFNTKEARNNCAHPEPNANTKETAKEARRLVYKDEDRTENNQELLFKPVELVNER